MNTWKTLFDKTRKPVASDLKSYFTPQAKEVFDKFIIDLNQKMGFFVEHSAYTKNAINVL